MTHLPERAVVRRTGRWIALSAGGSCEFEFTVGPVEVWAIRGVGTGWLDGGIE